MNEDLTVQHIQTYVEAHEELKQIIEAMFDGMAADLDAMPEGYDKAVLMDFLSKHLLPFGEKMNFLQTLYAPEVGGEENE